MTRVKRGFVARKRRNRVLKLAKGFRGSHSVLFRTAQQRTMRALSLSYTDRRLFKRSMRRLWIRRINSFVRGPNGFEGIRASNYSGFIHQLKKSKVGLNRKILSQLAVFDPLSLKKLVQKIGNS